MNASFLEQQQNKKGKLIQSLIVEIQLKYMHAHVIDSSSLLLLWNPGQPVNGL